MARSPQTDPQEPLPAPLRILQWLVIGLTASLIVGVIAVVGVVVTRFPKSQSVALPAQIVLPEGVTAEAFTQGRDWYAVVSGDEILIFDRASGALRQTVALTRP